MQKNCLLLIFLLVAGLVSAGENQPPATAMTPNKQLREQTLSELEAKNKRQREISSIATKLKAISDVQNIELRILEYLRLQKRIAKLQEELKDATSRQADLGEAIRAALIDPKITLQENNVLQECRNYVATFARDQKTMVQQLQRGTESIKNSILRLPPPASFTTRSELKMRLVGTAPNLFYVSEQCISRAFFEAARNAQAQNAEPSFANLGNNGLANVNLPQANAFCTWISQYEKNTFQLPDVKSVTVMAKSQFLPQNAIWTADVWKSDDVDYIRATERFSSKLQTIWDPCKKLSEEQIAGELPQATYKNLGFLVMTSVKTGVLQRLETLQGIVNTEE